MPRWRLLAFVTLFFPVNAAAEVIISEVMFDPEGSDTGLEWVELYNNGSHTADLSGWQLYPDGIGYYTFPSGASIGGNQNLIINLRTSGTDTATTLYHTSPNANAGNSSGSFALFSGEPRGKDTIKSFVRYQKPGSTERKTWESAAAEAGIWQQGTSVDIGTFTEGNTISYANGAWSIGAPTKGGSNAAEGGGSEEVRATSTQSFSFTPFVEVPRLKLEVLYHPHAVIGASHRFQARAFSENGTPVDNSHIRFLWNFGDGAVAEGPSLTHTYRFPGLYSVSLNTNSGSAIGSWYGDLSADANAVTVHEVAPGDNGYVKLQNASEIAIDLTGWILSESGVSFTLPLGSILKGKRALTIPNETSGIAGAGVVKLLYPNLKTASEYRSTPSAIAATEAVSASYLADTRNLLPKAILAVETPSESQILPSGASNEVPSVIGEAKVETAALPQIPSTQALFLAVLGLGIGGGALIVWGKRALSV